MSGGYCRPSGKQTTETNVLKLHSSDTNIVYEGSHVVPLFQLLVVDLRNSQYDSVRITTIEVIIWGMTDRCRSINKIYVPYIQYVEISSLDISKRKRVK